MELGLDDVVCAALDIRSAPLDIVTAIPPHLSMEAVLSRLDAAQLARCMCVSKAWRNRAQGALARLRALPPGQARHLRRAAPRVLDRVLRFFAAHCTSLRDVTVVGCSPLPSALRELVHASCGRVRRLELCIESGAGDPYSYDPYLGTPPGGVVVDDSAAWACDRDGIRSILAASGGGLRVVSLEVGARACAAAGRCAAAYCPTLVALRLSPNTLGNSGDDDDDDGGGDGDDGPPSLVNVGSSDDSSDDNSADEAEEEEMFQEFEGAPNAAHHVLHPNAAAAAPPTHHAFFQPPLPNRATPPDTVLLSDLLGPGAETPPRSALPSARVANTHGLNTRVDPVPPAAPGPAPSLFSRSPSLAATLIVLDLVYVRVSVDASNLADAFPALTHLRVYP